MCALGAASCPEPACCFATNDAFTKRQSKCTQAHERERDDATLAVAKRYCDFPAAQVSAHNSENRGTFTL